MGGDVKSFLKTVIRSLGFRTEQDKFNDVVLECRNLATKLNDTVDRLKDNPRLIDVNQQLGQARLDLQKLKQIVNWYPNIALNNLQGFEYDLNKIEQQVASLQKETSTTEQHGNINFDAQKQSHLNDLMRVINESIDIARKSKSNEISTSRLNLAAARLAEAQEFASRQSFDVIGFKDVEAEIERLRTAIGNGLSKVDNSTQDLNIYQTYYKSKARDLLTEAVQLKKQKRFDDACRRLTDAYSAEGSGDLMIEERLRLPMYLLLAGRGDEGWNLLNQMFTEAEPFNKTIIHKQMIVFLKKEAINSGEKRKLPEFVSNVDTKLTYSSIDQTIPNAGAIKGYVFQATLDLRTPLRVLKRHGERHSGLTPPPVIVRNEREGFWSVWLKSWREMGYNVDDYESTISSEIGQVVSDKFLPFLIAVRGIVERQEDVNSRILALRAELKRVEWSVYVNAYNGVEVIVERFFPFFTNTIPNVSSDLKSELIKHGYKAPIDFINATDSKLLSFSGLGKVRLRAIRQYVNGCNVVNNDRVDMVET